jgi:hypothetical protein
LSELVRRHAAALPDDLRVAVLVAVGLHPEARQRFLTERLRWALQFYGRDATRTVERLADLGLRRIAQSIYAELADRDADASQYLPVGWYSRSLRATFRLDLDQPMLRERREIVAIRGGLDCLLVSMTAPRDRRQPSPVDIRAQVVQGGELAGWARVAPGHFRGTIVLPRPLDAGESYHYEVVFEPSPRSALQPYCLLSPFQRCDRYEVRVRFDAGGAPAAAWRLPGLPRAVVEDFDDAQHRLQPDPSGWIAATFHRTRSGLSYGLRWL